MHTNRYYYYCTGSNLELPSGVVREIPILRYGGLGIKN